MSADGCVVPLPDGGGTCGWERDGRHAECAAHRRRMRVHGDYLAHVPVTRKPSRKPADVAQRRADLAAHVAAVLEQRAEQHAVYGAQLAMRDDQLRRRKQVAAVLA